MLDERVLLAVDRHRVRCSSAFLLQARRVSSKLWTRSPPNTMLRSHQALLREGLRLPGSVKLVALSSQLAEAFDSHADVTYY